MPKKLKSILESEVASKIMLCLFFEKEGLSAYNIGRMAFNKEYTAFPKVYGMITKLKKEGFVIEETIKGKRGSKILKPNLEKFFSVFNELSIPSESKLTEEEIKILSEWFAKEIDLKKIFEIKEEDKEEKFLSFAIVLQNLEERNILTIIAELFAVGSHLSNILELQKEDEKKHQKLELFYPFLKLPKEIREKLKNAEKSEIVDILIQFSILQINLLSDILNIKKSKK